MKVPLEPIPTEQMTIVEKTVAAPRAQLRELQATAPDVPVATEPSPNQLSKAYPWLLGASLCMSGILCWMYVTKPVIAPAAVQTPAQSESTEAVKPVMVKPTALVGKAAPLAPSENLLPGEEPKNVTATGSRHPAAPLRVDPGKLAAMRGSSSAQGNGWESTNLKVQHILSADSGNGELEKIILNVPVRYETRTMRWTPTDVEKARNVLARLMIYERDLNNLRQQGKGILKDWNSLLESTVPSAVLRADSPSLPYNHGSGTQQGDLPDSSSVIKVDKPEAPLK